MKSLMFLIAFTVVAGLQAKSNESHPLIELLGVDIRSKEAQAFLKNLNSEPKISKFPEVTYQGKREPASSYYDYIDRGISIRLDARGLITTIFLYAEGSDKFRQYQGSLPNGIDFSMTRKSVEAVLGRSPSIAGGGDTPLNLRVSYAAKKIAIIYETKSRGDLNARIHSILIATKI